MIQVASPVGPNLDAHMFFFRENCLRIPISVGIPLTENDIAFQLINDVIVPPIADPGTDGLVVLAKADRTGFKLVPLDNPVHARMYEFAAINGRSTVLEPIIVNAAEFPSVADWYSPLWTGATFFAPLNGPNFTGFVNTDLFLICPLSTTSERVTQADRGPWGPASQTSRTRGSPRSICASGLPGLVQQHAGAHLR